MAEGSLKRAVSPEDLRRQVAEWRAEGRRIAFVPTMGALHAGHLSLVERALSGADRVVASIFVNPTQFGPHEDFESYPRSVDDDCRKLEQAGCHLAFLPEIETLYPEKSCTWIEVEEPSKDFEGDERPGHFRGVATVVLKLFNLVQPDVAIFGQKDAQQLAVIRQMTRDLLLPIEIVGAPIVREADGLALSSRNVYLDPEQRRAARVLSRSLNKARQALESGERDVDRLRATVQLELDTEPLGRTDYVAVVNGDTFQPLDRLDDFQGNLVVAIVFRLGETRLLDNLQVDLNAEAEVESNESLAHNYSTAATAAVLDGVAV